MGNEADVRQLFFFCWRKDNNITPLVQGRALRSTHFRKGQPALRCEAGGLVLGFLVGRNVLLRVVQLLLLRFLGPAWELFEASPIRQEFG